MPNLAFYAVADDWAAVVRTVFELELFRVFEADSEPGTELREFSSAAAVSDGGSSRSLMLFAAGSGPGPVAGRIDLDDAGGATFRYTCEGWGLIQLEYGGPWGEELRWSRTNHNTVTRATAWAGTYPELGDPADWDWAAVTKASSRLNRAVRNLAVDKIGSHPVLPHAGQFIVHGGLKFEYGTGIHPTPS